MRACVCTRMCVCLCVVRVLPVEDEVEAGVNCGQDVENKRQQKDASEGQEDGDGVEECEGVHQEENYEIRQESNCEVNGP